MSPTYNPPSQFQEIRRSPITRAVIGGFIVIAALVAVKNSVQNLDASHIMVIQSPATGKLTWHTTPGWKWQGFGKVTEYKKRHQFWFSAPTREQEEDQSLSTRFNDNGTGRISGSLAWEMPTANENLNALHTKYGSDAAIEQQIIRTATEKAVTMTGPLMSSTESFAARRNDLLFLILDQISHGVYRTEAKETKIRDEMTGVEKTIRVVNPIPSTNSEDRGWARQEASPLDEFKLHAFNLAIKDVAYDSLVFRQIKAQQEAIMQVQTAIAEAKTAEQAALTTAKNGEAAAAKAKWEQEVIKAKEVTTAQQRKEVAALDVQTADLRKKEQVLLGEGEAERRRLVMNADGALEKKLEAWIEVQKAYAQAIKDYSGQWVPSVVMGSSGGGVSGAADLVQLLTARTAQEIGLQLAPAKRQ